MATVTPSPISPSLTPDAAGDPASRVAAGLSFAEAERRLPSVSSISTVLLEPLGRRRHGWAFTGFHGRCHGANAQSRVTC